ncbi:Thermophilic serine proteinase precursor [Limihaloglobus sulfuriphilus]|uniref:Thermophilic serine proteinase n=1 Tax=Limihaloglobus sulfuriphilus TaxID=1851148 RepID=A0A1Q2MCJ6_9BACT|nr:S8 family serine peptidase [Limihaloglobus sulfuriphilus]AQQ70433.1 Thermophilic serine proteinase precursor [Limihaloglobus sulfuriphilus]
MNKSRIVFTNWFESIIKRNIAITSSLFTIMLFLLFSHNIVTGGRTKHLQTSKKSIGIPSQAQNNIDKPVKLSGDECITGEILVKLKKNSVSEQKLVASNQKATKTADNDLSSLEIILKKHRIDKAHQLFSRFKKDLPKSKKGKKPVKPFKGAAERSDMFRWYKLIVPTGANDQEVLEQLLSDPDVEAAELNHEWRLAVLPETATDPGYIDQWYLTNIRIQEAWQYLESTGVNPGGSRDVIVAVIDTGVDYTHEDIVGNMWINGGEISGNEIDDDGNGFVDDMYGCSVVSDERSHSGDPIDLNGHGTHVAGIIGATGFNSRGGVGVAFNVQIMAIRSAQYSGALAIDDIAEGLMYAADNGADVINMSFSSPHRSQIVEDALSVAFSQAVLVAAAGNDAAKTEDAPNVPKSPHYPAALPWVLGVMASTQNDGVAWNFSNYDSWIPTRIEYEALAPGVEIYSTLPNNQYAKWSGTSMATPIVAGIAALIRSVYPDHAVYSNRFIMGQIAGSSYYSEGSFHIVDAYSAVAESPVPEVYPFEDWIFEDNSIAGNNDGDGRVDAGETVHLAIELMNRWGLAEDLMVTVEARAPGAVLPDPYVNIVTGTETFDYGGIGSFNTVDNGLIYDDDGVIVGVENPFVFTVDPNCPNDHIVYFTVTINYLNALDPDDQNNYTRTGYLHMPVQRGRDVPSVISEDTELTADDYWLITGPVLVEQQATLAISPGTQVQWGGMSEDPYNPGPQTGSVLVRGKLLAEGTAEQPVSLFPSYMVSGQTTNITVENTGSCNLSYTNIRNPNLTGINWIDHCYLDWDAYPSMINAGYISNTIFHKLWRDPFQRWKPMSPILTTNYDTCLFNAGWQWPMFGSNLVNCTFLQDNEENHNEEKHPISITPPVQNSTFETLGKDPDGAYPSDLFINLQQIYGAAYVALPMEWPSSELAELIASYYGGHVASILNYEEEESVRNYLDTEANMWWFHTGARGISFCIGLTFDESSNTHIWTDQNPVTYTNWATGYPVSLPPQLKQNVIIARTNENGTVLFHQDWINAIKASSQRNEDGWLVSHTVFILKMPAGISMDDLLGPVENGSLGAYVLENQSSETLDPVRYNAFLSQYWDPNLDHWMRIIAPANNYEMTCYLHNNFWGTDSTTLIDHAIWDYYDDFTSARIYYGTPPENGYESTYPFVERVMLNGTDSETVPVFGAEQITFQVVFNRDMNSDTQPFVSFGPITPYTDFMVSPIGDGWVDARTWEGSFTVTPMTGDGYHQMRISDAVAADDPWLVTGYDVGRFRFDLKTMGVAAMTLQASGGEGRIDLMWQQDDFDLLAGYNLYRSDTIDGVYEQVNGTIIPVGLESYADTGVAPAAPNFYKFTVVQTDLEESNFSNIASAAALDTIVPVIAHAPKMNAVPGLSMRLTADVTDNVRVMNVTVYYRALNSEDEYKSVSMEHMTGDQWTTSIPGSGVQPPGLEYYIIASDGISNTYDGTAALPHTVIVTNTPTLASVTPNYGPAAGGTSVNLSGVLFQEGASVFFGEVLASDIVVLSGNQIICTAPPHFPAMVDVRVANPDITEAIFLNGFQYRDEGVILSMPVTSGNLGTLAELELSAANVSGLSATTVNITFDSTVLSAQSATTGTLTAGWSFSANTSTPGRVSISMANASEVSGTGTLARITFEVNGTPSASTALTIESAELNEGTISYDLSHGSFVVNGFFSVSGNVSYFGGGSVPDVSLSMVGVGIHSDVSDEAGLFSISNVPTGSYALTPTKSNDISEITSFDASLILQSEAGLRSLSSQETLAGDVTRNGTVSSMDASYILKKAVGLIEVPFPGAGKVWDFNPSELTFPLLNGDQNDQNFTAILIGDVSGNWKASSPESNALKLSSIDNGTSNVKLILLDEIGKIDGQVVVPVQAELVNAEVYSTDLTVSYDSNILAVDSVTSGEVAGNMAIASNIEDQQIRIALAGAEPITTDGTIAKITFKVIGMSDSAVPVSFLIAKINEGNLETTVQDGSVKTKVSLADFNGDKVVNIIDFVFLANSWLSEPDDTNWDPTCNISQPTYNIIDVGDLATLTDDWLLILQDTDI